MPPRSTPTTPGHSAAPLASIVAMIVALATVALTVDVTLAPPPPVAAQSEGNGLDETSVNTFLYDASRGIVRVQVDITLENVTTDRVEGNVVNRRYWDGYYVAVPLGAENIVVTRNGRTLVGELTTEPDLPAFLFYEFPLGTQLFSGQSTTLTVTYDHLGAGPRNPVPWRVNAAYASFVAYGLGDDGQVTIRIVKPVGYEFDDFTELDGYERSEPDGFGSITYTRAGLDETFGTAIGMSNDDRLVVTPLDVPGVDIDLRSWPGDDEWKQFATSRIETGIPELEELVGSEWPVEGGFEVRQTVEPYLYGYAGWFDEDSREIAVGEDLDGETIYHELSHAWFNGDFAEDRWVTEGLAQVYAAELMRRDGQEPTEPSTPDESAPGAQRLLDWSIWDTGDDVEEFGYNASYWVADALVDEIGFDAMRSVILAVETRRSPFDLDAEATPAAEYDDWHRLYDMLVEVGGARGAADLYEDHVLDDDDVLAVDLRTRTDLDYEDLVERSAPWSAPVGIRHSMELWEFDDVTAAIDDADEVLTRRAEFDALVVESGVAHPDTAGALYAEAERNQGTVDFTEAHAALDAAIEAGDTTVELQRSVAELSGRTATSPPTVTDADDFTDANTTLGDQVATLERLDASIIADRRSPGVLERIGLLGTDVAGDLDAARTAIDAGDNADAVAALDSADDTLAGASDAGRTRALVAAAAVAILLAAVTTMIVRRRRRRSGRGLVSGVDGLDDLGRRGVDLDEDALAGAHLGGVDHTLGVAAGHDGQTARSAGVVERPSALGDVGDAVLQLDEDVVAVVDADAVAGAEVLIDPDAHDSEGR